MKNLLLYFFFAILLAACNASPPVDDSILSIKEYVNESTGADIQVLVASQRDTDGDFNNLQRELIVQLVLPTSSNLTEVALPNGLILKRGVRSSNVIVLMVYSKDNASWKATKVELAKYK